MDLRREIFEKYHIDIDKEDLGKTFHLKKGLTRSDLGKIYPKVKEELQTKAGSMNEATQKEANAYLNNFEMFQALLEEYSEELADYYDKKANDISNAMSYFGFVQIDGIVFQKDIDFYQELARRPLLSFAKARMNCPKYKWVLTAKDSLTFLVRQT